MPKGKKPPPLMRWRFSAIGRRLLLAALIHCPEKTLNQDTARTRRRRLIGVGTWIMATDYAAIAGGVGGPITNRIPSDRIDLGSGRIARASLQLIVGPIGKRWCSKRR